MDTPNPTSLEDLPIICRDDVESPPSCHFLGLPRELRDLIYEELLVCKDEIIVLPQYCQETWENMRLRNPMYVDTWTYTDDTFCEDPELRSRFSSTTDKNTIWSYKSSFSRLDACIGLDILYISRQIYHEAARIFYEKNTFLFNHLPRQKEIVSIPCCEAFLKDRSPLVLKYITRIGLSIEFWNILECCSGLRDDKALGPNEEPIWLKADTVARLVSVINANCSLKHLSLSFRGWLPDVRCKPWNWTPPWYRSVCEDSYAKLGYIGALLELRKLDSLSICWRNKNHSDYEDALAQMVAGAAFLRARLLRNGEQLGTQNIRAHKSHWVVCEDGCWQRDYDYELRVECEDDALGKSTLLPVAMLSPPALWRNRRKYYGSHMLFEMPGINRDDNGSSYDEELDRGSSDEEFDWFGNHNNETDSAIDLRGSNTTYVIDEEYLQSYRQLPYDPVIER